MYETLSPADSIALAGNRNNGDMFGGNGAWWIIVLFLFMWGRNGWGNGGATDGYVLATDFANIERKLDGVNNGICDSTFALNNSINQNFRTVDNAICTLGYNVQNGFNNLSTQVANCCCEAQRAIDGVNYNLATQACDVRNVIQNSTRDIIDNANANSRAILDFLTTDKINTLTAENQALRFQASQTAQNAFISANQEAQTAELIRRLGRDVPVPAYVVPNPNCCYTLSSLNACGGCGCNC